MVYSFFSLHLICKALIDCTWSDSPKRILIVGLTSRFSKKRHFFQTFGETGFCVEDA